MGIDIYSPCMVHPEKKIKFCCGKDVVGDLDKVIDKYQAGQSAAALDAVNQLIERVGPRDCLLTMKVQLLESLEEFAEAETCNQQFLQNNPQHPLGLKQRAVLLSVQGKLHEAFEALQDAMDGLPGAQIPTIFSDAFASLAGVFVASRMEWAAISHAQFALALSPDDQQIMQIAQMGVETLNRLSQRVGWGLPALGSEADQPWAKRYENAGKAIRRGQFRKAVQLLDKALETAPDSLTLRRGRAMALTNTPYVPLMSQAFAELAADPAIEMWERIEFAQIHQLYREAPKPEDLVVVSKIVWEFTEPWEALNERALSHSRLVAERDLPKQTEPGVPPPRAQYYYLDRPAVTSSAGLEISQIPNILASFQVFGKQSDRSARLEIVVENTPRLERDLQELRDILGVGLSEISREKMGEMSAIDRAMESNWHLPPNTTKADFARLEKAEQMRLGTDVLPGLKFAELQGCTLAEACQRPDLEVAARALLTRFESKLDGRPYRQEWVETTYAHLKLAVLPAWKPDKQAPEAWAPLSIDHADWSGCTTSELEQAFLLATSYRRLTAIQAIATELLTRPAEELKLGKATLLLTMATLTADDDDCFAKFDEAKRLAPGNSDEQGVILVNEFEQRLIRGRFVGLRNLTMDLQRRFAQSETVLKQFSRVLLKYGLLTAEGRIRLPREDAMAEEAPAGGLWTPDSAGSSSSPSGGGSKLWVPGQ
jgi:tetratricopeptide (TPR) repeat protein